MTALRRSDIHAMLVETDEDLYDQAPCGFLTTEADGTIVRANRKIAALTGLSAEEMVGRIRLQELFTVGGRVYYETHIGPLLLMQGHVEEIALDVRHPDGAVPVLLNAELRRQSTGEVIGIRASMLDATHRRRYERELLIARDRAEEAARTKSEMIAMVSHDIRSPLLTLTTVAGLFDLTPLSEDQARYVKILKSSTNHLVRMVNDVLDLARLESGHLQLVLTAVDLGKLVEGLVEEIRVEADRKGLRFAVQIDSTLPPRLLADGNKLGRVLSNIMGNAVKFTDHGEVGVSVTLLRTDHTSTCIAFEIRDTGIGIQEDQIHRIFEDFTQGGEDIANRFGGSGLGLGICQKFLALHGTELTVVSKPGEGSRFRFELELEHPPAPVS